SYSSGSRTSRTVTPSRRVCASAPLISVVSALAAASNSRDVGIVRKTLPDGSGIPLRRLDDHHGARGVVAHRVGHAAQDPALALHAPVADDDQIGLLALGHLDERVGRAARADVRLDLHAV